MNQSMTEYVQRQLSMISSPDFMHIERTTMVVDIIGKAGCDRCEKAKEHVSRMGYDFNYHDIDYHTEPHEGWQEDGSIDILAHAQMDDRVPVICLDDQFYNYAEGMKVLKKLWKINT